MVKIEQLEVRFDVEGDGDEAAFARLFEAHIRRWSRAEADARSRQRQGDRERELGDRAHGSREDA